MKKTEKLSLVTGLSFFALTISAFLPVPAGATGAPAQGDTVSAIGDTPAPAAAGAQVPTGPDGTFPPQPVSVAPAEDQSNTAATADQTASSTPTQTVTPAPAANAVPVPVQTQDATTSSDSVSAIGAPPSTTSATPVATTPANPAPQPADTSLTPIPTASDGTISGTNVMGDSGARQKHSGTYYDANALVPDSDLAAAGATGPRKVDPAYEPGQKFVVVEKGARGTSFEGQYVAATRALKLGRYAAAMEMFEKLYKRNHKDPRILMGLAVAQQGAGFNESAARTYEDLLKIQPNNADAIVNLMGIMKGQYPSVTLKKLMELRNKYPSNPGIPAQIALVNAEQENYDDAVRFFEVAASMDPRNASHVYNMAIVFDKKGDVSGAIRNYEKALQLDASYGDMANSLPREQIYDRLVVLRRKV